jgi:hypothetical protein
LMHCFALSLAVPQSSPVCASSHTHFPLEHAPCPLQTCWFSPRTHCFLFWQASPSNSVEQKHFPYRHSPCLLHSFGHATFSRTAVRRTLAGKSSARTCTRRVHRTCSARSPRLSRRTVRRSRRRTRKPAVLYRRACTFRACYKSVRTFRKRWLRRSP